ncbi:MAG: SpoIIE family protein phosphatase [Desulfovibrionaceae bacterium]|nr:SpoIIE family protein phosphatase [Desulfovibrionaceae bacterium]MBF0512826.1 SpoIIE family protein phosphatase [Desulfovibrionaceae bacterium]
MQHFVPVKFADRFVAFWLDNRPRYWAAAVFASLILGMSVLVEVERYAESGQLRALEAEASRRSIEIMSRTSNGKIMGYLSYFGLTSSLAKDVAVRLLPADTPAMRDSLRFLGEDSKAEGSFIVDKDGVIATSWDSAGISSTGMDVRYRPYFRNAMAGKDSIYAAVSVNTGRRALYFAAPVHADIERASPVVGAAAIRIGLQSIDELLLGFRGYALLLTPNKVVFASTNLDWNFALAGRRDPARIQAIRDSKQFGRLFDTADPKPLPFSLDDSVVWADGRRYALAKAPVAWNDPQGDWTLVLLDDQSNAIGVESELWVWGLSSLASLLLFFLALVLLRNHQIKFQAREAEILAAKNLRDAMEVIAGSIRYASRIQRAVLPDEEFFAGKPPERFALWKPRDVVGGDIYWYKQWGEGQLIILADCTGHGVPGAFMTLIAGGALEVALRRVEPGDPAGLIAHMHKRVQNLLSQHVAGGDSDDGLELGVCYIAPNPTSVVYAGAHFPLFIRDPGDPSGVTVVKGDRSGIGYRGIPPEQAFTNVEIAIAANRRFYLATDGLFDQIGERTGRSFGKKRFMAAIEELDGEPFTRHGELVFERLEEHRGAQARRDDLAVIGFTFGGNHAG